MRTLLSHFRRLPDWAWLALGAALLRFINLGSEGLWYDESFTAWLVKLRPADMFQAIQGDVHPPLWYIVEWLNVQLFGASPFALRLPSAVLGVLVVLLVWRLAGLVGFERRTALLAGGLAAVLPGAVYYSQEARMYSLLAFFILWATISAIKGRWLFFALASIGAIYSQNLAVFYILAIGIAVTVPRLRAWRDLIRPGLAGAATVGAWSVWLPVAAHQAQSVGQGFWISPLTAGGVFWPLASMTMGWRLPDNLEIHIYGISIALSAVGLIACRKWIFSRAGLIVLAVVIGAPAMAALVSVVWRDIYLPRAMLPSALGMCLIWAYPLNHLSKPNRLAARAIVAPCLVLALLFHYFPAKAGRNDFQPWARTITDGYQVGDLVYYLSLDSCILMHYYLPPDLPYAIFPESGDLSQSLSDDTKQAMQIRSIPFEHLRGLGYKRVWLVVSVTPLSSSAELAELDTIRNGSTWLLIKGETREHIESAIYRVDL
jgi:4-amino-4-deoxy-L-arabinose transferase-like glycosyltransferase